jgi:predicted nuclease of predicted toxin-antitoxin system
MLFKVDENLPIETAEILQLAGHDAVTILDQQMGGQSDSRIGDIVCAEKRALITLDLDFADIRSYPPEQYAGLIVLRLAAQDKPRILSLVMRVVPMLKIESLIGSLWIVDENAVRIRGEAR